MLNEFFGIHTQKTGCQFVKHVVVGRVALLVLVAQQVVDGLYRVEGAEGNLYEDGAPVAHGAVPESW